MPNRCRTVPTTGDGSRSARDRPTVAAATVAGMASLATSFTPDARARCRSHLVQRDREAAASAGASHVDTEAERTVQWNCEWHGDVRSREAAAGDTAT